jgi:hypothetical protein
MTRPSSQGIHYAAAILKDRLGAWVKRHVDIPFFADAYATTAMDNSGGYDLHISLWVGRGHDEPLDEGELGLIARRVINHLPRLAANEPQTCLQQLVTDHRHTIDVNPHDNRAISIVILVSF